MLSESVSRTLQLFVAIAATISLLFQCEWYSFSGFILIPALLALVACAWWLAIDAVITKLRRRPAKHLWTALVLATCLGPAFPLVDAPFRWLSAAHKLSWHRSEYTRLVERAEAGEQVDGFYMTEEGPPRRYSFAWGGFADNWCGIAHDSSETLDSAPASFEESALAPYGSAPANQTAARTPRTPDELT